MPLSSPSAIAAEIVSDIDSLTPPAGTPVSPSDKLAFWTAVVTRIYDDLQANAQVAPGSFAAPSGGGPISGDGGPIL